MSGSQVVNDILRIKQSQNEIRLRRVIITPTLVLFAMPEPEETNRVIRKYKQNIELFVRTNFTDENLSKGYYFGDDNKQLLHHIYTYLKDGILLHRADPANGVGEARLKSLSYSNSQMKNHSLWMVQESEDKGLKADTIIKELGEFEKEPNPLKKLSR